MDSQSSPFHAGERAVQERLGVRSIETWARKMVRDYLPEQHRLFHTSLPFVVAAARDDRARPWVTLVAGEEGFVTSPDERTLLIRARPTAGDALADAFAEGADVGLLGIDFETRRRNRANGRVSTQGDTVVFTVDQTFGNCPQYIRQRAWRRVERSAPRAVRSKALSVSQRTWIRAADTFLIASGFRGTGESATYGMDASHRGGEPGFVQVQGDRRLVFPDYAGNNHYNTIGNLTADARVGVTFVDFATGSLLQLTGVATIDWDSEAVSRVAGARRLVTIEIDEIVELSEAIPLRWSGDAVATRSLRVVQKVKESETVTSFVMQARDGGVLPDFEPGQHLPIEVLADGEAPLRRTYSLSAASDGSTYRISVKRESKGRVSRLLHDEVEPGMFIHAQRPAGDFVLMAGDEPAVLISAGVGVTPMLAMLQELSHPRRKSPVWFFHAARHGGQHPFRDEVAALASRRANIAVHVVYSQPRPEDVEVAPTGRLEGSAVAAVVDDPRAHYYLCGPLGFMAALRTDLERSGVPTERIHTESFGPR